VRRPAFTEGRYLSEAVTLPRALLGLAVLVAITVAVFGTIRLLHEPPHIDARITSVSVDDSDDQCWWVIGLVFTNPNEDAFTVRSVELPGVDGSARSVIGVLDGDGSRDLTYRFPLPSCDVDPVSLGVDELRFSFSPRGSRAAYEQTIAAPELGGR
jgi:hypothetical protein